MPAVDLKSLFLKLNQTCQAAFNNALSLSMNHSECQIAPSRAKMHSSVLDARKNLVAKEG